MEAAENKKSQRFPRFLIILGLFTVPAFLFQENLFFLLMQTIIFITAAWIEGKKIRILPPVIMLLSVVALNLFTPLGKVFFSFWRISLTTGALRLGLEKGLTLIGLIYLSRAAVRPDLRLPGKIGSLISRTFYYFDQIIETWKTVPKQPIIQRLDALIIQIQGFEETKSGKKSIQPRSVHYFTAGVFFLMNWVLFALQFFLVWDLIQPL